VTVDFDNPVRYEVTLTNLTGLDLSGAGRITGRGLQVDSLDVDVKGAGLVKAPMPRHGGAVADQQTKRVAQPVGDLVDRGRGQLLLRLPAAGLRKCLARRNAVRMHGPARR
jgi:hypothetical protein